jgi:energy-coupling factor transporter ATP-binding protein EcfA2
MATIKDERLRIRKKPHISHFLPLSLPPSLPPSSGVSLTLRPGTMTAVVGPSGAGKTTLTQILSRFYAPSKGDILLDGRPLQVGRGRGGKGVSGGWREGCWYGCTILPSNHLSALPFLSVVPSALRP